MRKKYDGNRQSILGRLWRWHINWCPGWKSYMKSMPESDRSTILTEYDLTADKWQRLAE
jgi:hypothetical protein